MGRSSKAAKRPKLEIAPEEKHHVAELEDFLFGGGAAAKVLRPVASGGGVAIAGGGVGSGSEDDELDIADLIREVGEGGGAEGLLIVEDRAGEAPDPSLLRQTRRQRRAAAAAAARAGAGAGTSSDDGEGGSEGVEEEEDSSSGSEEEEGGGASGRRRGGARRDGGGGAAGPGPGSERDSETEEGGPGRRRPVWVDPADADLRVDISSVARLRKLRTAKGQTEVSGATYEAALRRQHVAIHGGAATWAALPPAGGARRRPRRAAWGEAGSGSGSGSEGEEGDEAAEAALLRSAGGLLASRRRGAAAAAAAALPQGTLELSQLRDANAASPGDAVVRSVEFHPGGQLLLSAGFDKKLRLFAVDGVRNPLVQAVHLEDCPVHRAAFAAGGGAVIAAGRRPFFYVVDLHASAAERVLPPPGLLGGTGGAGGSSGGLRSLESFAVCNREDTPLVAFLGDGGHVGLLSLRGRQAVGSLKLNGSARAAAFTDDGMQLLAAGGDGVVYTFDLRTRRCLGAAADEGSVGATALAVSGGAGGGWLAAGSSSGVVNLYRRSSSGGGLGGGGASVLGGLEEEGGVWGDGGGGGGFAAAAARASPFRALMQLTTSVDTLSFSRDGQLLLMASRMKKDALRLVHLPSGTVFSNWPTQTTPLHYVHCAAFSPGGGFMAVGNAKGRVLLYRLHHYGAA